MKYYRFHDWEESIIENGIVFGLKVLAAEMKMEDMPAILDRINQIIEEYQHALEFFKKGVPDDNRKKFFDEYFMRAITLVRDASMCYEIKYNFSFKAASKKAIQVVIDNHVKEALLSKKEDPEAFHKYLNNLFYALLVSFQWDRKRAEYFIDLLTDERLGYPVVKTILSAIMLSCFQVMDYNKLYCLIQVYKSATDERVRLYALIGWVLGYHIRITKNCDYLDELIGEICADEKCANELFILQKNLLCLYTAKEDGEKINAEVYTKMINDFKFQREKLNEKFKNREEEITEDDILEITDEENMEELANSTSETIDKLRQMEREGADIHYAGFSKMKSYTFFRTLVNWFVPFYKENPIFATTYPELDATFLKALEEQTIFCDNDKYSFAFSIAMLLKGPQNKLMKKMFSSEALVGIPGEDVGNLSSTEILRHHIKDLVRFYNLSGMHESFNNPFEIHYLDPIFFLSFKDLYRGEQIDKACIDIAYFLAKRKRYDELDKFFNALPEGKDKVLVEAALTFGQKYKADEFSETLLSHLEPYQNSKVVALLIMKCFYHIKGTTEAAIEKCRQYIKDFPEEEKFVKHLAYFLVLGKHYEEARQYLAKLEYLHPDDLSCLRSLTWVYINLGELELARKLFKRILNLSPNKKLIAEDVYNLGLFYWMGNHMEKAIDAFTRFKKMQNDKEKFTSLNALKDRFYVDDMELLKKNFGAENAYANISMMLDCITEEFNKRY